MRKLVWIVLLAVVAGGAYLLIQNNASPQETAGDSAQLQTGLVERGDLTVTVRVTGNVQANSALSLGFNISGVVDDVLVEAGQYVEAGQILARLDGEAQRIGVEQAQLAVQIAELNLASLEDGPNDREVRVAQANVNSAWASFVDLRDGSITEEQIAAAELRYEQALAAWDAAEQASRDALRSDASLAQVGQASFNAEIARLQLEQIREGPPQASLNAAQAQVAQAQARLRQIQAGPRQADLDRAAISLRQAMVNLDRAQESFEDTVLRAPSPGWVHRVNIQAGGVVTPGGLPAVEIYDLSELKVIVRVDEIDVVRIQPGQPVELTFDALGDETFSGEVTRIADAASLSGGVISYDVTIRMSDASPVIKAGMTASATILIQQLEDILLVPNIFVALDRSANQAFVNVRDADGQIREQQIVLGAQNDTYSEVVEGLQEGDVVVIDLSGGMFSFFEDN
ncbi:MAG: efflux RND transporter periplasmic adaptor subunit [Anaerolineae bacterium]|nr:efflux RND transporter periplasmic adaptor subunit [Anaerolineae bacterium]